MVACLVIRLGIVLILCANPPLSSNFVPNISLHFRCNIILIHALYSFTHTLHLSQSSSQVSGSLEMLAPCLAYPTWKQSVHSLPTFLITLIAVEVGETNEPTGCYSGRIRTFIGGNIKSQSRLNNCCGEEAMQRAPTD